MLLGRLRQGGADLGGGMTVRKAEGGIRKAEFGMRRSEGKPRGSDLELIPTSAFRLPPSAGWYNETLPCSPSWNASPSSASPPATPSPWPGAVAPGRGRGRSCASSPSASARRACWRTCSSCSCSRCRWRRRRARCCFLAWILAVFYLYGSIHHHRARLGAVRAAAGARPGRPGRAVRRPPSERRAARSGAVSTASASGASVHGVLLLLAAVGVCVGFVASVMYLVQVHRLQGEAAARPGHAAAEPGTPRSDEPPGDPVGLPAADGRAWSSASPCSLQHGSCRPRLGQPEDPQHARPVARVRRSCCTCATASTCAAGRWPCWTDASPSSLLMLALVVAGAPVRAGGGAMNLLARRLQLHRRRPIELREQLAFDGAKLPAALRRARAPLRLRGGHPQHLQPRRAVPGPRRRASRCPTPT